MFLAKMCTNTCKMTCRTAVKLTSTLFCTLFKNSKVLSEGDFHGNMHHSQIYFNVNNTSSYNGDSVASAW